MWASWAEAAAGSANIAALTAARASSIIFLLMLCLSSWRGRVRQQALPAVALTTEGLLELVPGGQKRLGSYGGTSQCNFKRRSFVLEWAVKH
jgi:hypothetical protein